MLIRKVTYCERGPNKAVSSYFAPFRSKAKHVSFFNRKVVHERRIHNRVEIPRAIYTQRRGLPRKPSPFVTGMFIIHSTLTDNMGWK